MPEQADETGSVRQIEKEMELARGNLARLREMAEQAVKFGKAQSDLSAARNEHEVALVRLGEVFCKEVEAGKIALTPELKRVYSEAKAKEIVLLRQQADISAILKEADLLAEKSSKRLVGEKKRSVKK